jgi:hypothetical protein
LEDSFDVTKSGAVKLLMSTDLKTELNDKDLYFFDRDLARETALKQNQVKVNGVYDATQVCYYDGVPIESTLPNLVHLPIERFVDFFSATSMRVPEKFIGEVPGENDKGLMLAELMEDVIKIRKIKTDCYASMLLQRKPDFRNDKPWRVYMPASIYTDVWQYCLKNLAKALRKKGCDARIFIEENDMHNNYKDAYQLLKDAAEFKPHIWVSISQNTISFQHPDMFHVIWWQDPRQALIKGGPVNWRDRDILFSQYKYVDELLKKAGAEQVIRQGIGIDLDVYRPMPEIKRRRKVVFVGSSYSMTFKRMCSEYKNNNELLEEIEGLLNQGSPVKKETIEDMGRKYNIPPNTIYERHVTYVIRERAVEWLCQSSDIEVEVYGRYWENNEIVSPFFKGELPYGEAVAKVYNEAEYALSLSAVEINTQRLAEIGACGCIPVVFDCRSIAEKPHWEDECLFFRNSEELYSCFNRTPSGNPEDIGKAFSYDIFAEKILTIIQYREGSSAV